MAGGGGDRPVERRGSIAAFGAGGQMSRHQRVAGAGDAPRRDGGRRAGDEGAVHRRGGRGRSVGDEGGDGRQGGDRGRGGAAVGEGRAAQRFGLGAVEIDADHAPPGKRPQKPPETGGLLGACRDDGDGSGEGGVGKQGGDDRFREVAVEDGGAAPRAAGGGEGAVAKRREEREPGALETAAIGHGRVEGAGCVLDGDVSVGGAGGAVDAADVDSAAFEVGEQGVACRVDTDGGDQRDGASEAGEGGGDVAGDAPGGAGDAAGHVGAGGQRAGRAADHVPVGGADAEDRQGEGFGANRAPGHAILEAGAPA